MHVIECADRFYLNEHERFDNDVSKIFADDNAVVGDRKRHLRRCV